MPTTIKKAKKSTSGNHNHFGTYTVARGHVSIGVPPFWAFRQTNEDIEIDSPTGNTSLIVTAYQKDHSVKSLDAREYLAHFLESAPKESRVKREEGTKARAAARYRDQDGHSWYVEFVTNGKTLLLAEVSAAGPLTGREAKTAIAALQSLKLKKK